MALFGAATIMFASCASFSNNRQFERETSEPPAIVSPKNQILNQRLIQAVSNHRNEQVRSLIADGADVNAQDDDGKTALDFAAIWGNTEALTILLANDAHINARDNYGRTPLMGAARSAFGSGSYNHEEIVRILIARRADIDARDNEGATALMHAVYIGNLNIVKLLIANEADPNIETNDGTTALSLAISLSRDEIANFLRQHDAR